MLSVPLPSLDLEEQLQTIKYNTGHDERSCMSVLILTQEEIPAPNVSVCEREKKCVCLYYV